MLACLYSNMRCGAAGSTFSKSTEGIISFLLFSMCLILCMPASIHSLKCRFKFLNWKLLIFQRAEFIFSRWRSSSFSLYLDRSFTHTRSTLLDISCQLYAYGPEGRPGMSNVSPLAGISGLSFYSTLQSPLLFFCLVLLPFLLALSSKLFSRKFFNIFC